jgi:phosphoribosyl 1,2-cyclic phosphate phosphodiesterase
MKITLLGSGASSGVPIIGCDCVVCQSPNPKNKRSRVSLLIETQGKKILIDTSPDLRTQCLREGIKTVDAILYTHAHADHIHGIDDIRSLNFHRGSAIPCYADAPTMAELHERFGYVFKPPIPEYGWFRPCLIPHEITAGVPFEIEGIKVIPFRQNHGRVDSMGYRIGDVAYSTDVKSFPAESEPFLQGLKLWVVDCLKPEPAPTHAHLALSLEWIAQFKPERAVLTHLAHEFDYEHLQASLPAGVGAGYDGMVLTVA